MGQETIAQLGKHFNFINFKELITLVDLAEDLFADHLKKLAGLDFIIKFAAAITNLFYQLDCLAVKLVNFFR